MTTMTRKTTIDTTHAGTMVVTATVTHHPEGVCADTETLVKIVFGQYSLEMNTESVRNLLDMLIKVDATAQRMESSS